MTLSCPLYNNIFKKIMKLKPVVEIMKNTPYGSLSEDINNELAPSSPIPFFYDEDPSSQTKKKICKIPLKKVVGLDYPEKISGKKRIKKLYQVRLKYLDHSDKLHVTHVKFGVPGRKVHPEKMKTENKSNVRCSQFWDVHWGVKNLDERGPAYLLIRRRLGLNI